jgi:cell division transport system ATP-binding protein
VRRRIGVVHQDFRLLPHLTAFENVALPLRIMEREEGTIRSSVAEMLDWMGLAARAEARPATLSGGEQQRVAIARALIAQPELMVADEPMANLDRDMAARILRLLDGLNRTGATILVATRDPGLAACVPNASVTRLARGGMEDLSGPQRPPAAPRRAYP